jgi:hypothetical protein
MSATVNAAYEKAKLRVEQEPALQPWKKYLIDDDWNEAYEHYSWVAEASIGEIVDWAAAIRHGEEAFRNEQ